MNLIKGVGGGGLRWGWGPGGEPAAGLASPDLGSGYPCPGARPRPSIAAQRGPASPGGEAQGSRSYPKAPGVPKDARVTFFGPSLSSPGLEESRVRPPTLTRGPGAAAAGGEGRAQTPLPPFSGSAPSPRRPPPS